LLEGAVLALSETKGARMRNSFWAHDHLRPLVFVRQLSQGPLLGRSTNRVLEGRQRGLEGRALDILAQRPTLTRTTFRDSLGVENERLGDTLVSLELPGQLCRTPTGWQRSD
jgi:hypothetical protein